MLMAGQKLTTGLWKCAANLIGKLPMNIFLSDVSRHAKIEGILISHQCWWHHISPRNTLKNVLKKIFVVPEWRMPSPCPPGCATHQLSTDKRSKMNLLHKI